MRANLNMDGYKVPGAGLRYQTDQNITEDRKSLTARADALGVSQTGYRGGRYPQAICITQSTNSSA